MSEENVSKLRLKPKLVVEPEVALRQPVASPVVPDASVPAVEEPKPSVRLKPKLSVAPAEPREPSPPSEVTAGIPDVSPTALTEVPPAIVDPLLPPEAEKPASRFSLKPKAAPVESPAPAPVFPPPPPELRLPAQAEVPMPAPVFVDPDETTPPPLSAAVRSVTARPFPPPPANFPPPPAGGVRPAPPWAHSSVRPAAPKKNIGLIIGVAFAVLLVLGGGFVAYKKFTAVPPPAPVSPPKAVVAPPPAAPASLPVVEQAKAPVATQAVEASAVAPTVETKPVAVKSVESPVVPPPVEVPPPPASAAFKAWVDNLRVGGVRPGANPRVFIGGNSYLIGDVVNPQLGIIFDGYNSETRKLTFRDKTGAKVDRRN